MECNKQMKDDIDEWKNKGDMVLERKGRGNRRMKDDAEL